MRKNLCLVLLTLLVSSQLFGQELREPANIIDVTFEGLINVQKRLLLQVYRPYIGRPYSENLINELSNSLYALEYFNLITTTVNKTDDGSVNLLFKVEEREKISRIKFKGASASLLNQLRDTILISTSDDYYIDGMLAPEEQAIRNFYKEKGYIDTIVSSETSSAPRADNSIVVTFTIEEGIRLRVRSVKYEGNKVFSEAQIRAIPSLKLTGLAILFKSEYSGELIQQDKSIIELFYKKKGYLDFSISEVREEIIEEKTPSRGTPTRFLRLVFVLNEGLPYTFGEITLSGNILYSNDELLALFKQQSGDVFDYLSYQRSFESLRALYFDIGYVNNSIEYQEQKDKKQQLVSYSISIVERQRALIEAITISGNNITADDVILREIPLQLGDVFSRQELMRGVQNLQYLGILTSVVPDVQPGSTAGLLRIILKVEEAMTVSVQAGLGFTPVSNSNQPANSFPFTINAELQDKNFLGRNYLAGLKGEVGFARQSLGLNFYNPRILGSQWSGGLGLSYVHTTALNIGQDLDGNDIVDPYMSQKAYQEASATSLSEYFALYGGEAASHSLIPQGSLAYTWQFPIGLQLARLQLRNSYGVTLRYLSYDQDIIRPVDERQRANYKRFLYSDSYGARLAFDTRDSPTNPLSGIIISQLFSLGGLLPTNFNSYYLSSRSRFDLYIPIVNHPVSDNWNFILGFSFHTGLSILMEHPFKPKPLNARENGFAISPFTTGRGWSADYGELLWENSLTLSWVIVRQIISFELFFDAIGLWREKQQFNSATIDDFRFSLGFGPRLTLPQLPLAFYIVKLFGFKNGVLDPVPEVGGLGKGWGFALHINLDPY